MNNTLTNSEIARVFAMYYGCDFIYEDANHVFKVGKTIPDGKESEMLLLTHLDNITDEHASDVANMLTQWENPETGRGVLKYILEEKYYHTSINLCFLFQYLASKGYAVPLFFAPGHWANGKTAIELGIAIKK